MIISQVAQEVQEKASNSTITWFQITTAIAAFGGLILGIINLLLSLYKDFWRKGKLNIFIEDATIKGVQAGTYDFQINILLSNRNKEIHIRNAKLIAPSEIFGDYVNQHNEVPLYKAITLTNKDLLDIDNEEFRKEISKKFETPITLRDLKVEKDSQISLTLVDRLNTSREPDGYSDCPLRKWTIEVTHNDGIAKLEFNFKKHSKSDQRAYFLH